MSRSQGARLPSLPLVTFVLLVAGLTTLVRDRNDDRHALWRVQGAAEPTLVSPSMLLALRCAFAAVLAAVTAYDLCLDPGFELNAELWTGSRAAKQGGTQLAGAKKLLMFTNQCYTLQCAYFIGAHLLLDRARGRHAADRAPAAGSRRRARARRRLDGLRGIAAVRVPRVARLQLRHRPGARGGG